MKTKTPDPSKMRLNTSTAPLQSLYKPINRTEQSHRKSTAELTQYAALKPSRFHIGSQYMTQSKSMRMLDQLNYESSEIH